LLQAICLSYIGANIMAQQSQAVAPAQSAVGAANQSVLLDPSELETIEQLGREYWSASQAEADVARQFGKCDAALFDLVKGRNFASFMAVRDAMITGCRDKGAPSDDAAAKQWERAVNRIIRDYDFERPKAETKAAKAMSEKRAKQLAELQAKTNTQLEDELATAIELGTVESLRKAQALAQEKARRDKPVLEAEAVARKAVLDKLVERAKELAKAKTADADAKLEAALLALS
jgi:hypothetical protein